MKKSRVLYLGLILVLAGMGGTAFGQMGGGMGPGGNHGDNLDDFPGWRGHEIEHNVVLPQIAVGDGVTMTLIFTNMGGARRMGWFESEEDYRITGTLRFFGTDGAPLPVRIDGVTDSEFPLQLEPSEASYLEVSAPAGSALQSGWLLIEFDDDTDHDWGFMDGHAVARGERAMVSAYYSLFNQSGELESQVAIRPMTFRQGYFKTSLTPAQFRQTANGRVRTGIAVVNTSGSEGVLNLRLIDEDGGDVAVESIRLTAGGQLARFIDELFEAVPEGFRGVLEISTEAEGIVTMGLLQTGLVTTSLPTHHYGAWMLNQ